MYVILCFIVSYLLRYQAAECNCFDVRTAGMSLRGLRFRNTELSQIGMVALLVWSSRFFDQDNDINRHRGNEWV